MEFLLANLVVGSAHSKLISPQSPNSLIQHILSLTGAAREGKDLGWTIVDYFGRILR